MSRGSRRSRPRGFVRTCDIPARWVVLSTSVQFGRTGRALDTCPKMNYLRDSLATGALKTMGKSRLALVAPANYGTVGRNPPPRRRNTELRAREYLTDAEISRLIVAASRNRHGHRDATMILIAYRHGLRVSELVALRWDAIDFSHGRLHVNRAKNGSPAVHPISGRELRALRQLKREQEPVSPIIFTSERGAPFTSAGFRKMVMRLGVAAKFKFPVHPHVAARLRVSIGQPGRRHPLPAGLSRAQKHPAHGALHR